MQSVSLLRRQRHGRWGAGWRPHRVERGCDPSRAQWLLRNAYPPNTRRKYVRLKLVGRVAQVVEQRPFKAWVAGSNPAALTISFQRLENSASSKNGVLVQIKCRLRNLAVGKGITAPFLPV